MNDWRADLLPLIEAFGIHPPETATTDQLLQVLHGVLATIDPGGLDEATLTRCEAVARGWTSTKTIVDPFDIPTFAELGPSQHAAAPRLAVVVADITTIAADVIVNAANQWMLGCRMPNHACIDNAIHSAAGPRLREDCAAFMDRQDGLEPVGTARLTPAHALPSNHVLHTVGPQLQPGAEPTDDERRQLQSCYRSCLETAASDDTIRTIAFCGISTGVFSFPKADATAIALDTIHEWEAEQPEQFDRLVIDCFSMADAELYQSIHDARYGGDST